MKAYSSNIFKYIFLLVVFIALNKKVDASHLVGGSMTYVCLGNDNYEITLTLFRDCLGSGAEFDDDAFIGVFDVNGNLLNTVSAPFTFKTPVNLILNDPCLVSPTGICIEKTDYKITVNLPPIAGGYNIGYQRCCRSSSAVNIAPNNQGSSYMVHVPETAVAICNSTPTFNNPPPIAMCVGFEFTYDLSATDSDGDSLFYSFADPINGGNQTNPAPNPPAAPPYNNIAWGAGYSTTNQIDANPQFTINPQTGFLIGTPTNVGAYTFTIGIKEYRNGVLIDEIVRDMLIFVTNCPLTTAEFSDQGGGGQAGQILFCTGTTVTFSNNSANPGSAGFYWDFGDASTITDTSTLFSPTYTYSDTGSYNVMLVSNPGLSCADTAFHVFEIFPALTPSFLPLSDQCLSNNTFTFNALGNNDPNDTIIWNFGGTATPPNFTGLSTPVSFSIAGTYPVELTIQNFGCIKTYFDTVKVYDNPIAAFPPQSVFCDGLTVSFGNNSINNTTVFWEFGDESIISDTSILSTPAYTYADSGTYNVTLIANQQNICYDTVSQIFHILPELNPSYISLTDQCLLNNSFAFNATGNINANDTVSWIFGASSIPQTAIGLNTQAAFISAGTYPIELTMQNFGCIKTYFDTVKVYDNPVAVFPPQSVFCDGLTVSFGNNNINNTSNFWDFGDASTNSDTSVLVAPIYTYADSGTYNVTLIANQQNICYDTARHVFEVYPTLQGSFAAQAIQCLPSNLFTLTALGNFNSGAIINWSFGLNSTPSTAIGEQVQVSFADTGFYPVNLSIQNYGCSVSYDDTLKVYPLPVPEFTVLNDTGCQPFITTFFDSSFAWTPMVYSWNFGDGRTSGLQSPTHTYLESGNFNVSLTISTNSGCIARETLLKQSLITVHPKPVSKFLINPIETYFLNHVIVVDDLSNVQYQEFNFGDGSVFTDIHVEYSYLDTGHYLFEQLVITEFGCRDTSYQDIWIKPDLLIFIPNAFTPDGNGLNEVFLPKIYGIMEYKIQLFDRWGKLFFTSENLETGWDGTINNQIAPVGVYTWKIEVLTVDHHIHKRMGNVNLIR